MEALDALLTRVSHARLSEPAPSPEQLDRLFRVGVARAGPRATAPLALHPGRGRRPRGPGRPLRPRRGEPPAGCPRGSAGQGPRHAAARALAGGGRGSPAGPPEGAARRAVAGRRLCRPRHRPGRLCPRIGGDVADGRDGHRSAGARGPGPDREGAHHRLHLPGHADGRAAHARRHWTRPASSAPGGAERQFQANLPAAVARAPEQSSALPAGQSSGGFHGRRQPAPAFFRLAEDVQAQPSVGGAEQEFQRCVRLPRQCRLQQRIQGLAQRVRPAFQRPGAALRQVQVASRAQRVRHRAA